jgi:hypothetical protein
LIQTIRRAASETGIDFSLERKSGDHEVWNLDGLRIPIPRHREVNEWTARAILRDAEQKLGKDWWR